MSAPDVFLDEVNQTNYSFLSVCCSRQKASEDREEDFLAQQYYQLELTIYLDKSFQYIGGCETKAESSYGLF